MEFFNQININLENIIDWEKFFTKFENFPNKFIDENINNTFKVNLNPIFRFVSQNVNEYYWGTWNLSFEKHGFGLKIISNNIFYVGSFVKDEIEGFGILIYNFANLDESNISYESNLRIKMDSNNFSIRSNDYSSRISKNNLNIDSKNSACIYQIFSEDESKRNKMQFSVYIGQFKGGLSEGQGELFLPNGEYYKGEFKNNKCHGKGEYHFKDKTIYKGDFIDNQFNSKSNTGSMSGKIDKFVNDN